MISYISLQSEKLMLFKSTLKIKLSTITPEQKITRFLQDYFSFVKCTKNDFKQIQSNRIELELLCKIHLGFQSSDSMLTTPISNYGFLTSDFSFLSSEFRGGSSFSLRRAV